MKTLVERHDHGADYTRSRFFINGQHECYGVEDEKRSVKVKGETCVPDGVYNLSLRYSPKFSKSFYMNPVDFSLITRGDYLAAPARYPEYKEHELIWITNVPNFEYVLLHWGNTDDDTDGCYIVGSNLGVVNNQPGVTGSKHAYIKLYPKIYKAIKTEVVTIEYRSVNFKGSPNYSC